MRATNITSPHSQLSGDAGKIMQLVVLACLPGLLALTYFFGWGSLINILWACLVAVSIEAIIVKLRNRDVKFYLQDYSAVVTAVLLGLALPPSAPWWLTLVGVGFAIVIAKHLYGGMGYNPFNPAMIGYVVLLISFPVEMTTWLAPRGVTAISPVDFQTSLQAIFPFFANESVSSETLIDGFVMATPLDEFKLQKRGQLVDEFWASNALFGSWSGVGWEWVNLGFLSGGIFLMVKKVITWHIPVSMLAALALLSAAFYDGGSSISHGSPLMHLLGGATMLGAFFIATDPVTAATSLQGKLVYGGLIGSLLYVIRVWGNYPDAIAFAVVLANFAAPFIDHYTQPRTYGHV